MRTAYVGKNKLEVDVPETWKEAEDMLTHALGPYYDKRGHNTARLSIIARVAHGMFGEKFMASEPTIALLYLLQKICQKKGAGLDQ